MVSFVQTFRDFLLEGEPLTSDWSVFSMNWHLPSIVFESTKFVQASPSMLQNIEHVNPSLNVDIR